MLARCHFRVKSKVVVKLDGRKDWNWSKRLKVDGLRKLTVKGVKTSRCKGMELDGQKRWNWTVSRDGPSTLNLTPIFPFINHLMTNRVRSPWPNYISCRDIFRFAARLKLSIWKTRKCDFETNWPEKFILSMDISLRSLISVMIRLIYF